MQYLVIVPAAIVMAAAVLAVWRFATVRSRGIPVVIRSLPNPAARHWRHGVLMSSGTCAKVFKLRSLRPESDISLTRLGTVITSRRPVSAEERHFLEADLHVVRIAHRGREFEVALDDRGDTALVSWLESGPSVRQERRGVAAGRRR